MSQLFTLGGQSTGASALTSFQRNPRVDLLQNGLAGSPCSPRDPQESSPTPQIKSISSVVLSLLHSPTLTSIHDHRKNHSLDARRDWGQEEKGTTEDEMAGWHRGLDGRESE